MSRLRPTKYAPMPGRGSGSRLGFLGFSGRVGVDVSFRVRVEYSRGRVSVGVSVRGRGRVSVRV